MAEHKRRRLGLQARLALAYAGLVLLTSVLLTFALFLLFRSRLSTGLDDHLRHLVALAATTVDADAHATLKGPADETTEAYRRLKRQCQKIRAATAGQVRYVYTLRANPAGQLVFVVDGETDPKLVSHLGDVYGEASPWMLKHLPGLAAAAVEPGYSTDRWGTWLSGYAPIYTSDGRRDGVLGMDIAAQQVLQAERRFLLYALGVLLGTVPLALGVGWWFGRELGAPVVRLKEEAEQLTHGGSRRRLQWGRSDELGELAAALGTMAEHHDSDRVVGARVAERAAELAEANGKLREEMAQRREAEESCRVAQERLELALRGADLGAWAVDLRTGAAQCDRRTAEMLGYDPEEVEGDAAWVDGLRHPEDVPRAAAALTAHLEGRTAMYEVELRVRAKTGEWRWILSEGRCVSRDTDGTPLRMAGTYLDITERRQLEEELRAAYVLDPLTGLGNRQAFEERLDHEWRRATRTGEPLSLIMCDVDHLESLNERRGRPAGDECLRCLAAVLQTTFQRALDFPARWGGDEFGVILASSDVEQAAQEAERLRRAIADDSLFRDGPAGPVTRVTVGVATVRPMPGEGRSLLQASADRALQAAKGAATKWPVAEWAESSR